MCQRTSLGRRAMRPVRRGALGGGGSGLVDSWINGLVDEAEGVSRPGELVELTKEGSVGGGGSGRGLVDSWIDGLVDEAEGVSKSGELVELAKQGSVGGGGLIAVSWFASMCVIFGLG